MICYFFSITTLFSVANIRININTKCVTINVKCILYRKLCLYKKAFHTATMLIIELKKFATRKKKALMDFIGNSLNKKTLNYIHKAFYDKILLWI